MSDQRMRELERRARETGDPADALAYRLHRIRHGLERMPETTYPVLELHLKSLQKKIKSYGKRAKKHGQIPLALHIGEKSWVDRPTPDGRMARLPIFQVTVIGDAPTTDDWNFIAALHHTPSGTVIQRAWGVTHEDFPEERLVPYREKDSACEHCNLRRRRNDTYVLQNKQDGTVIQVGRTCLGDFLSTSPEAALYQFKTEKQLTDMLIDSDKLDEKAKPEWGVPFLHFLTYLNAGVRRRGHYSYYLAGPAWSSALRMGLLDKDGALQGNAEVDDYHLARRILDDAREHLKPAQEGLSQEDHNLAVIVAEDTVSDRHARVASRILTWHQRHEQALKQAQREAERARFADPDYRALEITKALEGAAPSLIASGAKVTISADELARLVLSNGNLDEARARLREILPTEVAPASPFLGIEGETKTLTLTITRLRPYTRNNRDRCAVIMEDGEGRRAAWFAYASSTRELRQGQEITVEATIYRTGKNRFNDDETVLSRVRVQGAARA